MEQRDGVPEVAGEITRRPVPDAVGASDRITTGETVVIGVYRHTDKVVMTFQRPVVWVEMSLKFANEVSRLIKDHAKE